MTTIPSFGFSEMDASHLDDKMDVASSPFRQQDDFDVDLDSIPDPSILESLHDDMLDDSVDFVNNGDDTLRDQFDETLPDDDMIDEPDTEIPGDNNDVDYNMDAFVEEARVDEDEDVLYEEEENIPDLQAQEDAVELTASEGPHGYEEVEAEVILEEFEEHPEPHGQENLATNESNASTDGHTAATIEPAPQEFEIVESSTVESLEKAVEQPDIQGDEHNEPVREEPIDLQGDVPPTLDQDKQADSEIQPPTHEETEASADDGTAQDSAGLAGELYEETQETNQHQDASQAVHPVILVYLEEEMSLFPPMIGDASSVYFLPDSALASEPLDKLLGACREVLTGTLDHHDELVLDITGLGLHICEDSKYAAQITLSQILDVYLHLCHNEEGQTTRPLYCHLSSRVSLASQYAYLSSEANEGKTYGEVAADHMDTPEPDHDSVEATQVEVPEAEVTEGYQEPQNESHQDPQEVGEAGEDLEADEKPAVEEKLENNSSSAFPDPSEHQDDTFELEAVHDEANAESIRPAAEHSHDEEASYDYHAAAELAETSIALEESGQQDVDDVSANDQGNTDNEIQDFDPRPEQEESTETGDYPDEGQENDTNSSHTLQADPVDGNTDADADADAQDAGITPVDAEAEGFEIVDNIQEEDEFAHQPAAEIESYNDEDLFPQEDDEDLTEDFEATHVEIEDEPKTSIAEPSTNFGTPQNTSLATDNDSLSRPNGSHSSSAADLQPPNNISPPLTPLQAKQVKRKVEDDEDLEFLDFDTPEPKRRRPS